MFLISDKTYIYIFTIVKFVTWRNIYRKKSKKKKWRKRKKKY